MAARGHNCHPLWMSGQVRATCTAHWWQPLVTHPDRTPRTTKAAVR